MLKNKEEELKATDEAKEKQGSESEPSFYFYEVSPEKLLKLEHMKSVDYVLLESIPFGMIRTYRVATKKPVESLKDSEIKDTGRTNGWWQNLLGDGILRTDAKVKLSAEVQNLSANSPTATIDDGEAKTWTEIIENYVHKTNVAAEEKEKEKDNV